MTTGVRRPKEPDIVRARLLAEGTELLAEGGPVSMGAIAEAAGVTKGAVQHHFGTREQLLLAIFEDLKAEFEQSMKPDTTGHSAAYRYVTATCEAGAGKEATTKWRALLVASVIERALSVKWAAWMHTERKADGGSMNKLVARLAADGLWLSDTLGAYNLSKHERQELTRHLQQLAEED